ncbi:PROX2 protein, partial [Turnix velox]|nr:PROX2 protein [Turnix velox]
CAGDREQHLRAKRARVESIIQGMSLPPAPPALGTSLEAAFGHEKDGEIPQEMKRKLRVPRRNTGAAGTVAPMLGTPHAKSCQQLKEQLHFLEQQLKWLQEKFSQACDPGDAVPTHKAAKKMHPWAGKAGDREDGSAAAVSKVPPQRNALEDEDRGNTDGLSSAARLLSEALKQELAGVTSQVVDSVLKTIWPKASGHLLQQQQQQHCSLLVQGPGARREDFAGGKCGNSLSKLSPVGSLRSSQAQTLSGSSGKSQGFHLGSFNSQEVSKSQWEGSVVCLQGSAPPRQVLSQLGGCGNSPWGSSCAPQRNPTEPLNSPWGSIKLRSSAGRQQQQQQQQQHPLHPSPAAMESLLLLPPAGDEQIQEALTPGHLKKAKLMFFFTRYPSSTLLKTYFLDVQFSRCITSQLIKWFSNFREFYYIQVEKFARQALLEGVLDATALWVSRDSQLFRALNTHYNKGNDFEVPGRFLEVASLTLREFFSAVRAGKDADPSWKKPIYKIISKLDSDIPEGFKATSCPRELLHS